MKASSAAADLIKQAEGCRLLPYICPAGRLTIGYGHTGADVGPDMTITADQADQLLAADLEKFELIVSQHVTAPLTQRQFDALVSFCYNVGPGARGGKDGFVRLSNGQPSTMLRLLNEGNYAGAALEFGRWVKGGGQVLPGLVTRRNAEMRLFLGEAG